MTFYGNLALVEKESGEMELHIIISDHVTTVVKVKPTEIEGLLAEYRQFKR